MPPKGGNLTPVGAEVKAAVDYMLGAENSSLASPGCSMIDHLDHSCLTNGTPRGVPSISTRGCSDEFERFGKGRMGSSSGQKINLHEKGREFEPKAALAARGRSTSASSASVQLKE